MSCNDEIVDEVRRVETSMSQSSIMIFLGFAPTHGRRQDKSGQRSSLAGKTDRRITNPLRPKAA